MAMAVVHTNGSRSPDFIVHVCLADVLHIKSVVTNYEAAAAANQVPPAASMQTHLATETIQDIFAWIEPTKVVQYRLLSHRFNHALADFHFAVKNLSHFIPPHPKTYLENADKHDAAWFNMPPHYQEAYAVIRLSTVQGLDWQQTALISIRIHYAGLKDPLPNEFWDLTGLKAIEFNWCRLAGTIPPQLGNLINLMVLDFHDTRMSGRIPDEIGALVNLQVLVLNNNKFDGPLPPSIGNLSNLSQLMINNNMFSGTIPREIGNLVNLTELVLNSNQFEGGLPDTISGCKKLVQLDVSRNPRLGGVIPATIGDLTALEDLNLSACNVTGPIPSDLGACTLLKTLNLSQNKLSGSIPAELGSLARLKDLILHENNLSGEIPRSFNGDMRQLKNLLLGDNADLCGPVPFEICPPSCHELVLNMNATFILATQIQTQMIDCVDALSNGTAVRPSYNVRFHRQVSSSGILTPKARMVLELKQTNSIRYNLRHLLFRSERWSFVLGSCVSGTAHDINIEGMDKVAKLSVQRASVTRICASTQYTAANISTIFNYLGDSLTQVRNEAEACLTTYKMPPTRLGGIFDIDSLEVLVWLASQNPPDQKQFVINVCLGFFGKGNFEYYTFPELGNILELYSQFLKNTTGLTGVVNDRIVGCVPFYQRSTLSSIYEKYLWTPASRTWLYSQNTSTQLGFLNRLCDDESINGTMTMKLFFLLRVSNTDVHGAMLDCPKTRDTMWPLYSKMYTFIGLAVVAFSGFIAFGTLIYFELLF
ncbi:L domain-like protein [Rhizoclosmatium globosum]|uniref:L domain-like protein n=1 Tax=Rhizoclosmatium globosum TaxID=329046 RepID=A0A1Y2BPW0_9FUNG|nr:L domain-like protein [Rhizoclosmatium globosum]|eukprot:ORY36647.1 L domain-like protein [Rhizoclosmatium globosum]